MLHANTGVFIGKMTARFRWLDVLIPVTAVGLVATLAAPWLELQGTFQSWRIVEWHTFWRGEGAFQLQELVSGSYQVPVEFATTGMHSLVQNVWVAGGILGAWHCAAVLVLLLAGVRARLGLGIPRRRALFEITGVVMVNLIVLYALVILLALPSNVSLKVEFRTPLETHTDSLIWSNITLLPVAPVLSVLSAGAQVVVITLSKRHLR